TSDIVFHVALMHEIPDVEAFHGEVQRVLKAKGTLIIVDWEAKETGGGPPLGHRVPRERVRELLDRDGFTVVQEPAIYDNFYVIVASAVA
ncbi:MAG: hypothetical protein JRH20_11055, partial [Deltaproteobacteria bacterium]|nr:hypothetical protein [Deltaproteobacteria bacterium]